MHLAAHALDAGQTLEQLDDTLAQPLHVDAALQQQRTHGAALLLQQHVQQVRRHDEVVVTPDGERLRVGERRLELVGQTVHSHGGSSG